MFILCVDHSMILLFESTCTNVFNCKMGENTLWFNLFLGCHIVLLSKDVHVSMYPTSHFERFSQYFFILYSFHIIKLETGVYL